MFQLPRDMADLPVPPKARSVWGSVYGSKINSWFTANREPHRPVAGKTASARGFNALKAMLGELYDLDIKYYVEVNFQGFRNAVNTLGGVNINVQIPVAESRTPRRTGTLTPALHPGRAAAHDRHPGARATRGPASATDDFDRGRRQQRVLLACASRRTSQAIIANLTSSSTRSRTRSRPTSRPA